MCPWVRRELYPDVLRAKQQLGNKVMVIKFDICLTIKKLKIIP